MNLFSKLLAITFCLIAISCSKAKSPRWIVGEFKIIDAVTKEPVLADLKLRYYAGSIFGSWEEVEEIGSTDENGYFELKKSINRKNQQYKLEVFASGWYGYYGYYAGGSDIPDASKELSKNGKNEYTIEVAPIYAYQLTLNNTSCFDDTDSVWVLNEGYTNYTEVFTGCLDNFYSDDVDRWVNTPIRNFTTISKKNGIYDTIVHPIELTQGDDNNLILNY